MLNTNLTSGHSILAIAVSAALLSACGTSSLANTPVRAPAPARALVAFDAQAAERLLDEAERGNTRSAGLVQRMLLDESRVLDETCRALAHGGDVAAEHAADVLFASARAHRIFGTGKFREMALEVHAHLAPVIAGRPLDSERIARALVELGRWRKPAFRLELASSASLH